MEYLVDTNVISELRKPAVDPAVAAWYQKHTSVAWFSVVSIAEIQDGILQLPRKRRSEFETWFEHWKRVHAESILVIDTAAATAWAELLQGNGMDLEVGDLLLAAIAKANALTVATRDTGPFQHVGIPTVNPWNFLGNRRSAAM